MNISFIETFHSLTNIKIPKMRERSVFLIMSIQDTKCKESELSILVLRPSLEPTFLSIYIQRMTISEIQLVTNMNYSFLPIQDPSQSRRNRTCPIWSTYGQFIVEFMSMINLIVNAVPRVHF